MNLPPSSLSRKVMFMQGFLWPLISGRMTVATQAHVQGWLLLPLSLSRGQQGASYLHEAVGDWQGGRRLGFRKEEGVAAPCGRVEILEINFYFQPAQIRKQKKELHSSFIICSNSYFPDYIFTSSSASRVCKFVHRISFGPNTTCANKGAVFWYNFVYRRKKISVIRV